MKKHILPAIIAAVITVLVGSAALIPQQANADIICKLDIVPQEFKDDYNSVSYTHLTLPTTPYV